MAVDTERYKDTRELLSARAQRVSVDPKSPNPEILLSAARIIRHGGIVAYPTETVYGLAVDPFNAEAVEDLFAVKGRAQTEPFILLIFQAEAAFALAETRGVVRDWYSMLSRRFWPGPLTLVLPARKDLECPALAGAASVAVRVSSHPLAHQLTLCAGGPITSTSANFSGAEPPGSAEAIAPELASRLDLTLDAGPTAGGKPSTVLDLSGPRPELLRAGGIPAKELGRALGFAPRVRE